MSRFKAVDFGNRTGNNDAHGIGHIIFSERFDDTFIGNGSRCLSRRIDKLFFTFFWHLDISYMI